MAGPVWYLKRTWWRIPRPHLSEDRLLALALGTTDESARTATAALTHLQTCGRCDERLSVLTTLLEAMPEQAAAAFDEVITPQRLQTQRVRIKHRLAHLVGNIEPARVLAFPFSGRPLRRLFVRPGRWLAGAAAAGLLLGITAGQLLHYHPVATQAATIEEPPDASSRSAIGLGRRAGTLDMTGTVELPPPDGTTLAQTSGQPPGTPPTLTLDEFERVVGEEEFLGSLDLALTSFQVSELESIDALTPRVRELTINIR